MERSYIGPIAASFVALAAVETGPALSDALPSDAVLSLAGRWSGSGTLTPATGPAEDFKCVITYFPSSDGLQVKQNLRCKGPQSKFDAATSLQIADGKVTGKWQDNVYSLNGTVSGIVKDGGLDLLLASQFFQAKLTVVSSSPCEQSVKVVPDDTSEMKEMAAVLKRC
jgi:hypothetical protein